MEFDQKTIDKLKYYVYALIEPELKQPFYVGKGTGNRVFQHVNCALVDEKESDKYDIIRKIHRNGKKVDHIILRHGLTEKVALEIESTLIDYSKFFGHDLTNIVLGYSSIDNGLMSADEIIRKYNAPPLNFLEDPAIIININKTYIRGTGALGIYKATKEYWAVDKDRIKTIKYALSEYRGLIVEVFEINDWYPVETTDKNENPRTRWGFNGKVADESIRMKYINKSVKHIKKPGASNPIRYTLESRNKSLQATA